MVIDMRLEQREIEMREESEYLQQQIENVSEDIRKRELTMSPEALRGAYIFQECLIEIKINLDYKLEELESERK